MQACCSQRGGLSACQSPHRPPPALSPLAVGHLRSATRRLLQCQPPAGPSAHSLVQFLVARHAQTAQPNAATKTATSWPICAFASLAFGRVGSAPARRRRRWAARSSGPRRECARLATLAFGRVGSAPARRQQRRCQTTTARTRREAAPRAAGSVSAQAQTEPPHGACPAHHDEERGGS